MSEKDIANMSGYLNLSRIEFVERYVTYDVEEAAFKLRSRENNECQFFTPDNKCGIYPVRPDHCATYPFWENAIASSRTWESQKQVCEGIELHHFMTLLLSLTEVAPSLSVYALWRRVKPSSV